MGSGTRIAGLIALGTTVWLAGMTSAYGADAPVTTAAQEEVPPVPAAVVRQIEPEYRIQSGESLEPQRIVVTATRIPTPIENVPDSVTAFTGTTPGQTPRIGRMADGMYSSGDFESRQYRHMGEVLQNVPGVTMTYSGGPGNAGDLFMRGMASGNTQLLVDGMPMSDPSATDGHFNFGLYQLDNINQLEVMRGPQNVLYGSSASGGVINMTSRKGEGPLSGYASVEAGTHGTVGTRMGMSAGNEKSDFAFGGSLFHTDGFNIYHNPTRARDHKAERDEYNYGNANLRLGYNISECFRLDLFSHYMRANVDMDSGTAATAAYDTSTNRVERYMLRPQATLVLFDGLWEQKAGFGYRSTTRDIRYSSRSQANNENLVSEGETWKFDYQNIFRVHETNTILAGVDVVTDSMHLKRPSSVYKSGKITSAVFDETGEALDRSTRPVEGMAYQPPHDPELDRQGDRAQKNIVFVAVERDSATTHSFSLAIHRSRSGKMNLAAGLVVGAVAVMAAIVVALRLRARGGTP